MYLRRRHKLKREEHSRRVHERQRQREMLLRHQHEMNVLRLSR